MTSVVTTGVHLLFFKQYIVLVCIPVTMIFLTIRKKLKLKLNFKKLKLKLKNICICPPYIRHSPSLWENQRHISNLSPWQVALHLGQGLSRCHVFPSQRLAWCLTSLPLAFQPTNLSWVRTMDPVLEMSELSQTQQSCSPGAHSSRAATGTGIDNRMTTGQELQLQKHLTPHPPSPLPLFASRFLPSLPLGAPFLTHSLDLM